MGTPVGLGLEARAGDVQVGDAQALGELVVEAESLLVGEHTGEIVEGHAASVDPLRRPRHAVPRALRRSTAATATIHASRMPAATFWSAGRASGVFAPVRIWKA